MTAGPTLALPGPASPRGPEDYEPSAQNP